MAKGTLLLVGILLGGCTSSHPASPVARDAPPRAAKIGPPPTASEVPPVPPAPPVAAPTFIVGTDVGLVGLNGAGEQVRQYTKTRASTPRLIEGGSSVLFWAPGSGQLRIVSVRGNRRRALAEIPTPPNCPVQAPLDVWEDNDFLVDEEAGVVCLRLRDREELSDLDIVARIRLDNGEVTSVIESAAGCPHDQGARDPFTCEIPLPAPASDRTVNKDLIPRGFRVELPSPGGRWSVISGNVSDGDFIGRDLLVLDEASGELFPLAEGPWPAPVPHERVEALNYETLGVAGGSTVEWQDGGKRLLADRMLVIPGERALDLGGWLAR